MNENKNMDPKLETALKGIYDHLTDEQKEKAKACKNMDEMMALAGEWDIELPDEALDAVAGGGCSTCSNCMTYCPDDGYCPRY